MGGERRHRFTAVVSKGEALVKSIFLILWTLILCAGTVPAQSTRALTPPEKKKADELAHALVAPCCWHEPIATHRSAVALEMLGELKQLVVAGQSEQDIKSYYVAKYGTRILADPPGLAGTWLYVGILGLSLAAFVLLTFRLLRLGSARLAMVAPVSDGIMQRVRQDTRGIC